MRIYIGYQGEQGGSIDTEKIIHDALSKKYDLVYSNAVTNKGNPKDYISKCDVMVADVSFPTISLGIEMGWADNLNVDIICTCVKGNAIPSHLTRMSKHILLYTDTLELWRELEIFLDSQYKGKLRRN